MKYFSLFVLILLLASCSGSKRVVETNPKKDIIEIKNDTPDNDVLITKPIKTDTINKNTDITEPEVFKQVLTKKQMPIHQLWDELLQKHVTDNGNVNYKSFKIEHKKLLDYINVLSLIHESDKFESLQKDEKLAFWINAYNAMTIDLILRHYPIKSIKDIKNPWEQRYWKLGNKWYNLDEIEHQILRKMNEPRIHFAIVCASFSCPKLQNEAFTSKNLESQLTNATKEFLNDSKRNSISENNLELSKIFQWFSKDFEQEGSVINFINQYSGVSIHDNAKIKYKKYNWALNE